MKNLGLIFVLVASGVSHPVAANAAPVQVKNFSFEEPDIPDGLVSFDGITDWTLSGQTALYDAGDESFPDSTGNTVPLAAPGDGYQMLLFHGVKGGTASQSIGAIEADKTYTLRVAVGKRIPCDLMPYDFDLLADGVPLKAVTSEIKEPASGAFTENSKTYMIRFGADQVGQTLSVRLSGTGDGKNNLQVAFDNIRVEFVSGDQSKEKK